MKTNNYVRDIQYRFELLNKRNEIKQVLQNVTDCSITWQSLSSLKVSGKVSMLENSNIDYLSDRIRIYAAVNNVQIPLATLLLCSPARQIDNITTRDCECYSLLKILQDTKVEEKRLIQAGTNVVNEVNRLIKEVGPYESSNIQGSNKTISVAKIYEVGTTYLEIINDLLDIIGYTSLYIDALGTFTAREYILPQYRQVDLSLAADVQSLISRDISNDIDLFNIPNVFIAYTENIDATPLSYTYENNNKNSVTSTINRGRRIVEVQSFEVATLEELITKAKKMCSDANSVYEHLELSVALREDLNLYDDCIYVDLPMYDIEGKYILHEASYKCKTGENINLKLRRVVNVIV